MKIKIREKTEHANKIEINASGKLWVVREGEHGLRVQLVSEPGAKIVRALVIQVKNEVQVTLEK